MSYYLTILTKVIPQSDLTRKYTRAITRTACTFTTVALQIASLLTVQSFAQHDASISLTM